MAKVQSYTKAGVDDKFNSRSNMTMVHNGGGSPNVSAYPDAKTGDVIERSSDGARWGVVASTASPIAGRVVSVSGKSGVVNLVPGDIGAAPASHGHRVDQISDLQAITTTTDPYTIALRGSGGRLVIGGPTGPNHATTKAYVDSEISDKTKWVNISGKPSTYTPSSHTHTKNQITDLQTMAASVVNNSIVLRTASGQVQVPNTPAGPGDAASKWYVDNKFMSSVLNSENLNDVTAPGNYIQSRNENATTARNYPPGANAGHLVVLQGSMFIKQEYTDHKGFDMYYRTRYSDTWYPWKSITQTTA